MKSLFSKMSLLEGKKILSPLRKKIEAEIKSVIPSLGAKTELRDAIEYALFGGGKRIRPLIVHMVSDALKNDLNVDMAALSVEFFHTASLIADDIPCMDNDEMRRERPCLHKVYDESVAILASYTLISMGYEYIYKNTKVMQENSSFSLLSDQVCVLSLQTVTKAAGILGATNGQYLDLFPPDATWKTVEKVIYQKTVTLFEISFVLGWLFGGGDFEKIQEVKQLAYHMGMAFQIGDDLNDISQDKKRENELNVVQVLGKQASLDRFEKELDSFQEKLDDLSLNSEKFNFLITYLKNLL